MISRYDLMLYVFFQANVQVLSQSSSAPSQTVVLGNQIIKVQQAVPLKSQNTTPVSNIISNTISSVNSNAPHLGTLSVTNSSNSNLSTIGPKTVVLGSTGQTLRVQPSTNVNVQTACSSSQAQPLLLGTAVKVINNACSRNQTIIKDHKANPTHYKQL